jgi:hypothetical protein
MEPHPVHLVPTTTDDLRRSRLSTFFRGVLMLPHMIVLGLYGVAAGFLWSIGWFVALFTGRLPETFHSFLRGYLIYATRVNLFQVFLSDVFPPFGADGTYPVDLDVPTEATKQGRWGIFFRGVLAIPAIIMIMIYGIGMYFTSIWLWLVILVTGRAAVGPQRFGLRVQQYGAQLTAFLMLISGQSPRREAVPINTAPELGPGDNGSAGGVLNESNSPLTLNH